jgi:galactose-1-phosphate uridylyltransferase
VSRLEGVRFDFSVRRQTACLRSPDGRPVERGIEIRTHPLTGRTCRIALSRSREREPGTERLPDPPPEAGGDVACPFCPERLEGATPLLAEAIAPEGRLRTGVSVLFPNLYPYGPYSAVSLLGEAHFVEIGTAAPSVYRDGFVNSARYLRRVLAHDPQAVHLAVTQNHLPSAGGSLLHPHLQVQADTAPSNHHRFFLAAAARHRRRGGGALFDDYLAAERTHGDRIIGATGPWRWLAAFAPEGFYEIWGILPGRFSLLSLTEGEWEALARGVVRVQRFYRSLNRNGYNLGLLGTEGPGAAPGLRVVLTVRSNHAPWVRNDRTGFEVMLGETATFEPPEAVAAAARPFWADQGRGCAGAPV